MIRALIPPIRRSSTTACERPLTPSFCIAFEIWFRTVFSDMNEIKAFPSDATIFATGGPGIIFGKSTNSMINTGSAASKLYQQGAKYANGEFIQIHPTAIPGDQRRTNIASIKFVM